MTEILTTHAGSLPRSPELIAANAARPVGEDEGRGHAGESRCCGS